MLNIRVLPLLGPRLFVRTLLRTIRLERRIKLFSREANRRTDDLTELTKWVGFIFFNASRILVSGVEWRTYGGAGYDPGQEYEGMRAVCWEAPVGIMVHLAGRPSLGLGVELVEDILSVRQLQGVANLQLNKNLQNWPKLFLVSCIGYARETKTIREIRVYRADQNPFYWGPVLVPHKGKTYAEAAEEFRRRMRRRYDGTARQLGFKEDGEYYVWRNPNYARP